MSSQALTTQNESVKTLLARADYQKRFQEVLGKRAPQFMASISNAAQIGGLQKAEPRSIVSSAFIAATLDLPVDKNLGFCWIIPYKTSVKEGNVWRDVYLAQFQMGWKGFVQLAIRTGQYARMNAFLVNKEAMGGLDDCGEPKIDFAKLDETKEPVGYAFVWKLTNGFTKVAYWSKDKVIAHAARFSQNYRKQVKDKKGVWFEHFDAMALKTVVKNSLAKWGVLSIEMQTAVKHDSAAQIDIDATVMPAEGLGAEMGQIDAGEQPETPPESPQEALTPSNTPSEGEKAPQSSAAQQATPPNAPEEGKKEVKKTIQQDLEAALSAEPGKYSFNELIQWCRAERPDLTNSDSWGSFDDIDEKTAKSLFRSRIGLIQQLAARRLKA